MNMKELKLCTSWSRACLTLEYEDTIPSKVVKLECQTFFDMCEDINPALLTELEIELADNVGFEMGGLNKDILDIIYVSFLKELEE